MKKSIHIVVCACSCVFSILLAQGQSIYRDTINFEQPFSEGNAIYIDEADTVNTWYIGTPQKSQFNRAFSEPYCIFTDTIGGIEDNDTSSFMIRMRYNSYSSFGIRFNTRFSLAAGDSAYMEYSFDSLTWHHALVLDPDTDLCGTPFALTLYPFSAMNNTDTVAGMNYSHLACVPAPPYDTVFFRFTMVTGTLAGYREGWLIDDIVFQTGIQGLDDYVINDMRVYPNPATEQINLEWTATSQEEELMIRIVDMQGRQVYSRISGPNFSFPLVIPLEDLQVGAYTLSVVTGDRQYTHKFIKVER